MAHKGAVDGVQAVEKVTGKTSTWRPVSAESIYGGARNEIQGRQAGRYAGDGSNGYAATRWLTKGGIIYAEKYGSPHNLDLTRYSVERAREWGAYGNGGRADGLNGPLDDEAHKHLVKDAPKVTTLAELDAALGSGKMVTVCSSVGFNSPRDKDGFCAPRGSWSHCMLITGKRDGGRVGYLFQNSWGAYIKGDGPNSPNKYKDQPDGSFYVEPAVVLRILRAGDSYAIGGQTGFERLRLPDWLTSADAVIPTAEQLNADAEQGERDARVYQGADGQFYFRDDDGTLLRNVDGEWLEVKADGASYKCDRNGCRRVSRLETDLYATAA